MRTTLPHLLCASLLAATFFLMNTAVFAQNFQRQYGTAFDNAFVKVVRHGTNYYVLGRDQAAAGALNRATVTRLNEAGQYQWTLSLDIASTWNDAVLTPSGSLLVVGSTLPSDASSKSLMGLITAAGAFTWVRSYDAPGRETFTRIVRNLKPQNADFPYYILGTQLDPSNGSATWDDVVLLNTNESGAFNWKKRFTSVADDEFARDLEALPNGDMIIGGNWGSNGVILRIDNTGTQNGGAMPSGLPLSYADIAVAGGGGFYAVGGTFPNFTAYLSKYDNDLLNVWDATISGLTAVSQVWEEPSSGSVYVTGNGVFSGKNRAVVMRFAVGANAPNLEWIKYLDNGEASYTGGTTAFLSPGQMAFADGRIPASSGFGEVCAFLSVSDLGLASCMTVEVTGVNKVEVTPLQYNGPDVGPIDFYDVPTGVNLLSSALDWQQQDACNTAAPNLSCGDIRVQVEHEENGRPVYYDWLSAEGNLVTLICNPASGSFFPVGSTPVVCIATDVNGQEDQCNFIVTVEKMPFDSLQPPPTLTPEGSLDRVRDRFGNPYRLNNLQVPGNPGTLSLCTNSGYFDLYFEPGCGMDNNTALHIARRDVLCQLFSDLSNFIVPANPTLRVKIWVRDISQIPGVPNPQTSGILGLATAFYVMPNGLSTIGGLEEGEIWKTINSGVDSYTSVSSPLTASGGPGAGFYHGMMAFNFVNAGINWHTNLPTVTAAGLYDLYSVALHESVHALGFASLIRQTGQSAFGPPFSNYYSRYDSYLQNMASQPLITNTGPCAMYNYQFNPGLSLGVLQPNTSSCITNQTTCATALKFAGSVQQKVYTPNCFESGSSLSHLEDVCHSPGPYPNDQYYVMSNANGTGGTYMKRFLKAEERQVLCDLGYKVTTTYGNAAQITFSNYTGGVCPGLGVAGVNDGITSSGTFAYMTNVSTPITVSNVLTNDFQAVSFECLQVLLGGGSVSTTAGTSFNYTPTANPGTTLLRYTPVSASGKRGNITYVFIRVKRTGCTANPCELITNGNFELPSNCGIGQVPVCWDVLSSSPDVLKRGCSTPQRNIPNTTLVSPPGTAETWDNSLLNQYYMGLWGLYVSPTSQDVEAVQNTLASPLLPGQFYTLSFYARLANAFATPYLNSYIQISGSPSTLASVWLYENAKPSLSILINNILIPADNSWHYVNQTFQYTGSVPLYNFVVAHYPEQQPSPTPRFLFLDDIKLVPQASQPVLALPSPVCDGAGLVSLNATATPPGGVFTGTGVSGSYDFNPAVAGIGSHVITYTVTDINGCTASTTAAIQVVPCGRVCEITNRCLDFDGVDPAAGAGDFVNVPNPLTGVAQNNFTVACWFRNDRSAGTFFYRLFGFAWNGPRFEVGEQNSLLTLFITPGTGVVQASTNIRDGLWHHVAAVKSGPNVTIYLDCVPVITLTNEGIFAGVPQNFHIGDWAGAGQIPRFWQGRIDEFKVWGTALTPAEICDARNCSLDPNNANLRIHFPFDQNIPGGNNPTGTTVINVGAAGSAFNGTLTNFALNGNTSNWVARGRDLLPDCNVDNFAWLEGNPRRNIPGRTKVYEADIFSAGVEVIQVPPQTTAVAYPTFTRHRSDGSLRWRTLINVPGVINDFVRTDGGCYLLVGHTPSFAGNNRSFTALVDHLGVLQWLHQHNLGERESFVRIIRSDNPSNPLFPYTICGIRKNGGTSRDDILLFTMNDQGAIGWMRQIGNAPVDNEFRFDLMNYGGGYMLTGFYLNGGARGVLFQTNALGIQMPSTDFQPNLVFYDIEPAVTGTDIIIAGQQINNGGAVLARVTATGTQVWAMRFPNLTTFRKLLVQPNGDIYAVAQRNFSTQYPVQYRNVFVKVREVPGAGAVVDWQKYAELTPFTAVNNNENNWTPADLVWYSGKMFYFTDGRVNHSNGWGNEDIGLVMYELDRLNDICPVTKEMLVPQNITLTPAPMPLLANIPITPPLPLVSNPWYPLGMERDSLCADRCKCNFTKMWFRKKGTPTTSWTVSVPACGLPPFALPGCPGQTTPIYFSGLLQCKGNCAFNGINWTLTNPNGVPTSGTSGTAAFVIPITLSMVQVPGTYTLTITGKCGTETCICTVQFTVPQCPKPCDCAEPAFTNTVYAGFNWVQYPGCQFKFTPKFLTDCDQVKWQVALSGSTTFTTFANSVGNNTVSYTFPATNQYVVCWTVTRTPSVGAPCTKSRCWTIDVDCSLFKSPDEAWKGVLENDACTGSVVQNDGFTIGAEAGGLADEGAVWNWGYSAGNPEVVLEMGKADTNLVRLRGNGGFSDVLYQDSLGVGAERLHVSLAFRPIFGLVLPGTELVVRLSDQRQDSLICNDESSCYEILRVPISDSTGSTWLLASGYDSTTFAGKYLSVHVENPFVDDDIALKSMIDIDNVCLRKFNFVVSTTDEAKLEGTHFRLYPNPTTGELTTEWPGLHLKNGSVQLISSLGQIIRTLPVPDGSTSLNTQVADLPEGIYFVKILSGGRQLKALKFVKQ